MPFYEYRPKSGACEICQGRFVDLQKMSEPAHSKCPDCGKECERVIGLPIVSVRGAEYRAAANAENRAASVARAVGENRKLRESTLKKYGQLEGHVHNCALAGCHGVQVMEEARRDELTESDQTGAVPSDGKAGGTPDVKVRRFGGLPHLVGNAKDSDGK